MSESHSTALAVRGEAEQALGRPLPPMDDGEVAAAFRTAKALAESGLFKDVKSAGQAFAKILAGRELGLGSFESMASLHVIEGKIEASADLHATKVRQHEGYDFEVYWVKSATGRAYAEGEVPADGDREAVPATQESPTDLRATVGCAIRFTVNGEQRGVSVWQVEDTLRANLQRDRGGKTSPHRAFPRNMYFARAMTNGVAWYVPEVMGGVRVYGLGEIARDPGEDLTAGNGDPGEIGDDLPTEVEAVLARARELGHVGLQNRGSAAAAARAGGDTLGRWLRMATAALNRKAAGREPEPPDAEVVPDAQNPPVPVVGAETGNGTGEGSGGPETGGNAARTGGSGEVLTGEPVESREDVLNVLAQWVERRAGATSDAEREEASAMVAQARERLAALDPNQGALDV